MLLRTVLLGTVLLGTMACDRGPEYPSGVFLAGDTRPFLAFLEQLESLEGTPLANLAQVTRERLQGCPQEKQIFQGRTDSKTLRGLAESLKCSVDDLPIDRPAGSDIVWGIELAPRRHLVGQGSFDDDGTVTLTAALPDLPSGHPANLFLPSADAPGPTLLSRHGTLIHGRFKADHGLDLARLLPEDEQVEGLFQLKSRLFSGLALEGTWEIALYESQDDELIPPVVLAVEYSHRGAAEMAWNTYLRDIENAWGFVPTPITLEAGSGACLTEVKVLPGLAPCYVLTPRALVIAWHQAALERALNGEPSIELAEQSRLLVELDRLPESDVRLTAAIRHRLGETRQARPPLVYPWHRLTVAGHRRGGRYQLEAKLYPTAAAR